MRILVVNLTRPGHVLQVVADWWRSRGHEVTEVRLDMSHRKQLLGRWMPKGPFDLAVTAEPMTALRLVLDSSCPNEKVTFWRIDYRPGRYWGLARRLDSFLCKQVGQVWSIVPPSDGPTFSHYVPAMLRPEEIVQAGRRRRLVIWAGSNLDGTLTLAEQACQSLHDVDLSKISWAVPLLRLSDADLSIFLSQAMVGLALYEPTSSIRRYSDPARVKRFLGAGIPVVTTAAYPFWDRLVSSGAGVVVDLSPEGIASGVKTCLKEFEAMSVKAYTLAQQYIVSERWVPVG